MVVLSMHVSPTPLPTQPALRKPIASLSPLKKDPCVLQLQARGLEVSSSPCKKGGEEQGGIKTKIECGGCRRGGEVPFAAFHFI